MWILWAKSLQQTLQSQFLHPSWYSTIAIVTHSSVIFLGYCDLSLTLSSLGNRRLQVKLRSQDLIYTVISAIPLFFFPRTYFTVLISNIVIIFLPSCCTFYLPSSGLQPCRCYTSSTYLLNHISRCLKASTVQMSLISPRNFINSVTEKAR